MKKAFTLAEVLITLGIIGVVAAITIPSIIQDKIIKQRVSQLKKVYSALSQAYVQAVNENGAPDTWGMAGMYDPSSHYIMATALRPYLKLSKDCIDVPQNQVYLCNHLSNYVQDFTVSRSAILSDGTMVMFRIFSGNCKFDYSGTSNNESLKSICGMITVDLNGHQKPNRYGEDLFNFYVTKTGIIPYGTYKEHLEFEKACNKAIQTPYPNYDGGNMYACTAWVLYNENMDYLKCNDLSWDGKTKCK